MANETNYGQCDLLCNTSESIFEAGACLSEIVLGTG